MSRPLAPAGVGLVADGGLRRVDRGRVLIGGSPLRIVRLSEPGAAVVDAWLAGTPVADVKSARGLARRLLDAAMVHPVPAPASILAGDVTVVVPTRDDHGSLDRLLSSIVADGGTDDAPPVVVVDDGSVDPEPLAEVCDRHGARLIRRAECGGPAAARTTGLDAVETAFVVFVDQDVEVRPGWLDALAGHFVDEAVVAVAPRVRSRPGPALRDRYERDYSPLDLGPAPGPVGPGRPVAYVPTATLVARTVAIREVGGFDPSLRFGEDVDLVWRLIDAGGVVRYEPAVEVLHDPRPSWRAWVRQRWHYGASSAPLGARHGARVAPARCSRWSLLAWGAAALGRPLLGVGTAAGSSAALVPKLRSVPGATGEAARIAGLGHLHAGLGLARATARVWWPLAMLGAWILPRLRPAVTAVFVVPPLLDWWAGRRPAGPARTLALRTVDDLAYGAGVWAGALRDRRVEALRPDLVEWPGRRRAVEADTVGSA